VLSKKMQEALNEQINAELYSSYLYLSMAASLDMIGMEGFSHWMKIQAQEEVVHGMMIYDYVLRRDGEVNLDSIVKPESGWNSALSIAEATYEHEQKVTEKIDALVNTATEEKDNSTLQFLQWFVAEQVEEEANASDLVKKFRLAGEDKTTLFLVDTDLSKRPVLYNFPSNEKENSCELAKT